MDSLEKFSNTATYRTGIAARLSGVPVETLRVWERRYEVVGPRLSPSGQRLYSAAEIRRLTLIKRLVDIGHPISTVAALSHDALVAMNITNQNIIAQNSVSTSVNLQKMRVVLIGPLLCAQWVHKETPKHPLKIVARCVSVVSTEKTLQNIDADIVVIELPTLNEQSIQTIEHIKHLCSASQAIILYRFAPSAVIRQLRGAGYEVARGPSDIAEIELLCHSLLRIPQPPVDPIAAIPATTQPFTPRFDEQALTELAAASSTVYCECPRHLVELVISLNSFERYSEECVNRSPQDAGLHRDLQQTAAHARALMEDALLRVAAAEGISIPAKSMIVG